MTKARIAMNLEIIYSILAATARNKDQLTYSDLSDEYYEKTQEWHEPHGSWDSPLGELNCNLNALGWPPLSAVVVLKDTKEPGGAFWGSTPNVPNRPTTKLDRTLVYSQLLREVHETKWPDEMPLSAPQ